MAYTIKRNADGDVSLGNLRGEIVTLQPAAADYATGGYLIQGIGGATENSGNVGLDKVLGVLPLGGNLGYVLIWNPATNKLQVWWTGPALSGVLAQVPAATDLSALSFQLLVIGI